MKDVSGAIQNPLEKKASSVVLKTPLVLYVLDISIKGLTSCPHSDEMRVRASVRQHWIEHSRMVWVMKQFNLRFSTAMSNLVKHPPEGGIMGEETGTGCQRVHPQNKQKIMLLGEVVMNKRRGFSIWSVILLSYKFGPVRSLKEGVLPGRVCRPWEEGYSSKQLIGNVV
ncbi:hypothetical protein Tco_0322055 [Tanacetum coccineum]